MIPIFGEQSQLIGFALLPHQSLMIGNWIISESQLE